MPDSREHQATNLCKPSLICDWCHHRPVMDRCSICEECWYAEASGFEASANLDEARRMQAMWDEVDWP